MLIRVNRLLPLLMLASIAAPAGAQSNEIEPGLYRLRGISESLGHQDLRPLDGILVGAEVVGLGEAVHTTHGFSRARLSG